MAEVTFTGYLAAVSDAKQQHPEWRMGQTYFNVLVLAIVGERWQDA